MSNTDGLKIKAILNGYFENTDIDIIAYYITDTLYLTYQNMNLSFNIEDSMAALSSIFNGATGGDISGLINLESLQNALTDMKTTQLESGGQKIEISVPYIGDLFLITNAKHVPIFISATNVQLNNDVYSLSINLNSESKPFTLDTSIYKNIEINNYSEIISSVVKIITDGGATFSGNITSDHLPSPIGLELTINKDLEIQLSIQMGNLKSQLLYKDKVAYIDIFNNTLSTSVDDILKLINHYTSTEVSNFNLKVIDKNKFELNTGIGSFTIGLNITESNLESIHVNGSNFIIDLQACKDIKEITFDCSNAKKVTYNDLSTTIDKCINLLNANEHSIEVDGKINNLPIAGNCYVKLQDNNKTVKEFAFCGRLSGKSLSLYYSNKYYFLSFNGTNIKVSSECINDLIDYFNETTTINYIGFDSILEFINNTIIQLQINTNSSLSMVTANSSISLLLRNNVTEFNATNVSLAENTISLSAKIYANNANYKIYLTALDENKFTDCSKAEDLVKIVANTAKLTSATYTGNLTIGLMPFDIFDIGIELSTSYVAGKLKLIANLSNLPRTTALTNYNSFKYKNHKSTVTIYNGEINIVRTIDERFSGKTRVETEVTYKLNELSINVLKDILGLSTHSIGIITNASSNSNFVVDAGALAKGIEQTDRSLKLLTDSFKTIGISDLQVKLFHDSKHLTALNIDFSIKDILITHLSLEKK